MTFPYLFISRRLPGKPQSEWHRYDERMLCAVGFETAAIPEVVEHIGFQIQAEGLEYPVLYTDAQVHRPLTVRLETALQRVRRVGCHDVLLLKRAVDRHFKCYAACRICAEPSF